MSKATTFNLLHPRLSSTQWLTIRMRPPNLNSIKRTASCKRRRQLNVKTYKLRVQTLTANRSGSRHRNCNGLKKCLPRSPKLKSLKSNSLFLPLQTLPVRSNDLSMKCARTGESKAVVDTVIVVYLLTATKNSQSHLWQTNLPPPRTRKQTPKTQLQSSKLQKKKPALLKWMEATQRERRSQTPLRVKTERLWISCWVARLMIYFVKTH